MFKLDNKIGLGLASLGRPGYINIGHHKDIGDDKSQSKMMQNCHQVLDYAYEKGIRYFDVARVYGNAEEFLSSWIRKQSNFNGFVGFHRDRIFVQIAKHYIEMHGNVIHENT